MSSIEERLTVRMEHAMKAMMENMAKMHSEFEARMQIERNIMQTEIEAMILSHFGSSAHKQTETADYVVSAEPSPAVLAPITVTSALNKETATTTTSATSDIALTPPIATTTIIETPPNVTTALQPLTKTSLLGPSKPKHLPAGITEKPNPVEHTRIFSSNQALSNKELHTMGGRKLHKAKKEPPVKTSHSQNCVLNNDSAMNQGGEHNDWSMNATKGEHALRSPSYKAPCMPPHHTAYGKSSPVFAQDIARKLETLTEPRTEALKREDAIDILRRKRLTNLPEAQIDNAERYIGTIARLAQSVKSMRLVTSGFGCSPRWALSKRKKHMPPYMHETIEALPMVC